ncbi:MAG: S41 family peptidase [Blautia sp.]|nr:S41 family peptidase [Blautia sp.]
MDRQYMQQEMPPEYPKKKSTGFGSGFCSGLIVGVLVIAVLLAAGVKLYTGITRQYLVFGPKKGGVVSDNSSVLNRDTLEKQQELLAYMDIYYYEDYDKEKVRESILAGTLEGLDDPYSVYYTADEYASIRVDTSGAYYGIGAGLSQNAETMEVTITKVYEETPAEEAGLKNGDRILMVDDIEATSMELTALVQKIRGKEGTKVHLLVYREDTDESLEFDVERRNVQLSSVSSELLEGNIGYIQISEFQSNTPKQFEEQVKALEEQGMEGMIVDLRDNPGGLIDSVVRIVDDILPEGTIVYTEDKFGNRETYSSDKRCMDYPLIVLVDKGSASASEIFAGAIKDYDYGTLVGTTTFGKGIVQSIFPLEDGDAVKLTTAKYFTPNGNNIHGTGIEPDEVVEYEYGGDKTQPYDMRYDNQLQYAIDEMRGMLH